MSSKSIRHRHNQATESRLLDESPIEQRAVQIAREEGRGLPTEDDLPVPAKNYWLRMNQSEIRKFSSN